MCLYSSSHQLLTAQFDSLFWRVRMSPLLPNFRLLNTYFKCSVSIVFTFSFANRVKSPVFYLWVASKSLNPVSNVYICDRVNTVYGRASNIWWHFLLLSVLVFIESQSAFFVCSFFLFSLLAVTTPPSAFSAYWVLCLGGPPVSPGTSHTERSPSGFHLDVAFLPCHQPRISSFRCCPGLGPL